MRALLLALILCACPAIAAAAIKSGSASEITPAAAGTSPGLELLTAGNADGNHIAVIYGEAGDDPATLSGRVVTAGGKVKGEPVFWTSPDDTGLGGADAAIDPRGKRGLAVWRNKGDLVVRPFDARTAEPTAAAKTIAPTSSFFEVEAYRDGYAIIYQVEGGEDADHVIQFLDANGAPSGEPRVIHGESESFFVDMYRSRSGSRMVVLTRGPYGNTGIAIEVYAPDGKSVRKRINMRDDFLFDIAHASGAAFMTLWRADAGGLYLRRLTKMGKLGPVRTLAGVKAGSAQAVAYNEDRGIVVNQTKRCAFEAIEVTRAGVARGAAKPLDYECGNRSPEFEVALEPGDAGRFGLAFTATRRERDPGIFAAGLRLR